jgi:hypothetical protein
MDKALAKAEKALIKADALHDKVEAAQDATITEDNPRGLYEDKAYDAWEKADNLRDEVAKYSGIIEAVGLIPDALFTNYIKADIEGKLGDRWLGDLACIVKYHTPHVWQGMWDERYALSECEEEIYALLEERFNTLKAAHKRKRKA